MHVYLDTSPLQNDNSIRGVGVYTRFLSQELKKLVNASFQVSTSAQKALVNSSEITHVDIVHYPFFDLFFHTLPINLIKRHLSVVTIHDVIPLLFPNNYPVGIQGNINLALQKLALSQIDAVITDSQSSRNDLIKHLSIPQEKIHVTYLAGNPNIRKANTIKMSTVKKNYNLPEKYMLYVGDINYNKNIPNLISALQHVDSDIHLVCVGKNFRQQSIPEWTQIQKSIEDNSLQNRVHFITKLNSDANEELSAIYSLAACYVQPSYYEGFGLPVLEALQCNTPVICARNSSLIEIGGEVVEYCDTDPHSIAKAIGRVLSNPHFQSTVWQNKVKNHLQKFTWDETARQTFEVYKSIISSYH